MDNSTVCEPDLSMQPSPQYLSLFSCGSETKDKFFFIFVSRVIHLVSIIVCVNW